MVANFRWLIVIVALVVAPCSSELFAQSNVWTGDGATNDFADGNNWNFGFAPDASFFSLALIGADIPDLPDAVNTTAAVTTDLSSTPSPSLILGEGNTYEGTLNISGSGHLVTASGAGGEVGSLRVGSNGGNGFLNVSGSGILNVESQLASGGSGDSAINLYDSATVTAGSMFLERHLRIVGPSVSFSTTGNATLSQAGTHEWEFAASSTPSVLSVAGTLSLGGTLKVTLDQAPTVGDSWLIADSSSVTQEFANIDTSGIPGLGLGENVRVVSEPGGGGFGVQTSVVVEQQPVLIVNRGTGEVSIRNPGSVATVAIDTYDVLSPAGSLNVSNWDSISPDSGWQQANPEATRLSELNPLSSQAFAADTTTSLGNVFQPADRPFGEDTDDIVFQFAPEGADAVDGVVIYEGIATDTLTLNVDRTTGATQILNGFREAVSIDTYTILSNSGSLSPSPGGWVPIAGDWQVAENEVGAISELNPLSMLTLSPNAAQPLGNLYDYDAPGALEDLIFEFSLPMENFSRLGKVVFEDELTVLPPVGLPGDFNNDGIVNAADYTVWRDNLGGDDAVLNGNGTGAGTVGQADYDLWKSHFGATTAAQAISSAPVPEPGSWALAVLALPWLLTGLITNSRKHLSHLEPLPRKSRSRA